MSNFKNKIFSVFILISLSITTGFSQQMIDGIAAVVGEEIILYSDVNQLSMEMARQMQVNPMSNPELFAKLQSDALSELINIEIILLQAEVDSIYVKDRDVNSALEGQMQQYLSMVGGSEEQLEAAFGMSVKKLKEKLYDRVKSNMIVQQMQMTKFQNIKVTRPEIIKFFEENADSIPAIPERIELSHILISPKPSESKIEDTRELLTQIKNDILSGKTTFSEAAIKYSKDPGSAERGGELGFMSKGTFVPEFEKAAYLLNEPGEISPIIQTQFGLHILQLVEKRGETINVKHILLAIEVDDSDVEETIHTLSTLRKQIINKGDFETVALKYSEDPDVVNNKGYLGEFPSNSLQIKEFAEAANSLQPGEISEPFRTEYGVHIIKLINRKPKENIELYKHYNIIESMVLNKKQAEFWDNWLKKLADNFYVEKKI